MEFSAWTSARRLKGGRVRHGRLRGQCVFIKTLRRWVECGYWPRHASADLLGHRHRTARIALGVELRHVSLGMPQEYLSGFKAELLADSGSAGVPKLVRMPAPIHLAGPATRPSAASAAATTRHLSCMRTYHGIAGLKARRIVCALSARFLGRFGEKNAGLAGMAGRLARFRTILPSLGPQGLSAKPDYTLHNTPLRLNLRLTRLPARVIMIPLEARVSEKRRLGQAGGRLP